LGVDSLVSFGPESILVDERSTVFLFHLGCQWLDQSIVNLDPGVLSNKLGDVAVMPCSFSVVHHRRLQNSRCAIHDLIKVFIDYYWLHNPESRLFGPLPLQYRQYVVCSWAWLAWFIFDDLPEFIKPQVSRQ